jgi:hypothetical protein
MEGTLSFREIAHGHGSPGQIFKLPEDDIRARVEALESQTKKHFVYFESANLPAVRRHSERKCAELLKEVYGGEE